MKNLSRLVVVLNAFLLTLCSDPVDPQTDYGCTFLDTSPCASLISPPDVRHLKRVHSTAYDIFVIAGQSNTTWGQGYDSILDRSGGPRIFQLGRFGNDMTIIEAKESLDHHGDFGLYNMPVPLVGFGLSFCKWYATTLLDSSRNILIIPCGAGGTGFGDHRWNKGDDLYEDAVARTNFILDQFPESDLKAILWHQGETDATDPNFQYALDSMIVNFRKDLRRSNEALFILGGMVPYWVDQSEARKHSECILKTTPSRIPRTAFVDPRSPCLISKVNDWDDEIHYDAQGQRELGFRYFNAYRSFK